MSSTMERESKTDSPSDKNEDRYVEHSTNNTPLTDPPEPELHLRTWLVLVACCVAWSGINFGVTSSGFWLGYVLQDLGNPNLSLFFAEGFLLLQVAATPAFGLLTDFSSIVRKYTAMFLLCVGGIGMFVAGSAKTLNPQGIAGICLFGCSLIAFGPIAAIAADAFPRRLRSIVQGTMYASIAFAAFLANVGGGRIIEITANNRGWRWNLYQSAIYQLVGAAMIFIFYNPLKTERPPHGRTFLEEMKQFDYIGSFLFAVFVCPFLIALIWGSGAYAWSSPACIATLTIGFASLAALVVHQYFLRKDGIFNHRLFRNRNFAICIFALFVEGITYISLNIFLAQQIGTLYGPRPVILGLHFGVILLCNCFTSLAWGYWVKRSMKVKAPVVVGFVGFAGACAGYSQLTPSNVGLAWAMDVLVGVSFGAPQALLISTAQLAVEPELTGLASSHIIGLRSFGGAVGAAISGAIFSGKLKTLLPQHTATAAAAAGVPADRIMEVVGAVLGATAASPPIDLPGITAEQIGAAQAGRVLGFAASFSFIYYSIIPWCIVAAIALLFLRSVKEDMTWHVSRPAEVLKDKEHHEAIDQGHADQKQSA